MESIGVDCRYALHNSNVDRSHANPKILQDICVCPPLTESLQKRREVSPNLMLSLSATRAPLVSNPCRNRVSRAPARRMECFGPSDSQRSARLGLVVSQLRR